MDQPPRVPLPRADGLGRRQGLFPPKRNAVRYGLGDGFAEFPRRADEQAVFADDHTGFRQVVFPARLVVCHRNLPAAELGEVYRALTRPAIGLH